MALYTLANIFYFVAATINQHKATQNNKQWNNYGHKPTSNYYAPYPTGRSNSYVNPGYRPPSNKYVRPGLNAAGPSRPASTPTPPAASAPATPGPSSTAAPSTAPLFSSKPVSSVGNQKKEIVLGGVAFESSGRSLVRKDRAFLFHGRGCGFGFLNFSLVPKATKPVSIGKPTSTSTKPQRQYIRKPGHVPPGRAFKLKARRGRNMTLNNTRRPYPYVMAFFL